MVTNHLLTGMILQVPLFRIPQASPFFFHPQMIQEFRIMKCWSPESSKVCSFRGMLENSWKFLDILLMEEIPNNHLGCQKPCK